MQTLIVFIVSVVPGDLYLLQFLWLQTANKDNLLLLFFIFSTRVLLLCSDLDLRKHFLPASLPGGSEVSQKLFLTSRKFKPSIAAPLISLRTWMLTCKSSNLIREILFLRLTLSISFSGGRSSFKVSRFFWRAGWFAIWGEIKKVLSSPLL